MHSVTAFLLVAIAAMSVFASSKGSSLVRNKRTPTPVGTVFESVLQSAIDTDQDKCMLRLFCEIGANRPTFGAYGQRISSFFSGFTSTTPTPAPPAAPANEKLIVFVTNDEFQRLRNQSTAVPNRINVGRHLGQGNNILFITSEEFQRLRNQSIGFPGNNGIRNRPIVVILFNNQTVTGFNKHGIRTTAGRHLRVVGLNMNQTIPLNKHNRNRTTTTFNKHHRTRVNAGRQLHNGTIPSHHNGTIPSHHNGTIPSKRNCTVTSHHNCTVPSKRNCTVTSHHNCTVPSKRNGTIPSHHNCTVISHHNCTIPSKRNGTTPIKVKKVTVQTVTKTVVQTEQRKTVIVETFEGRTLTGPATTVFNNAYYLGLTRGSAACNATFSNCTMSISDIAAFARTLYPF